MKTLHKGKIIGLIIAVAVLLASVTAVIFPYNKTQATAETTADYTVAKDADGNFVGIGLKGSFDGAFYAGIKKNVTEFGTGIKGVAIEYRLKNTVFDKENGGLLIHLNTEGRTKDFSTRVYAFVGETTNRMMVAHAGLTAAQCNGVNRYFIKDNGDITTLAFSRTNNRVTIPRETSGTMVLPWAHMTDNTNGTITTTDPELRIVVITDLSADTGNTRADQGITIENISTYTYSGDVAEVVTGFSAKNLTYTTDAEDTTADVNLADIKKGKTVFCSREWNTSVSVKNYKLDTDNSNVGLIEFEKLKTVSFVSEKETTTKALRAGKRVSFDTVEVSGKMFIGWTSDTENLTDLYGAESVATVTEDITYTAVGVNFNMKDGAAIKLRAGSNGIRFISEIATSDYNLIEKYVDSMGTLVLPTKYLEDKEFVLENFVENKTVANIVKTADNGWFEEENGNYSYVGALVNVNDENTNLDFSARGYLVLKYSDDSTAYVYTPFDKVNNSRSMYRVAEAAFGAAETTDDQKAILKTYFDKVADLTVTENKVEKANENASYSIESGNVLTDGTVSTVVIKGEVKVLTLNGVRISLNASVISEIEINGLKYSVTDVSMTTENGETTVSFKLTLNA